MGKLVHIFYLFVVCFNLYFGKLISLKRRERFTCSSGKSLEIGTGLAYLRAVGSGKEVEVEAVVAAIGVGEEVE